MNLIRNWDEPDELVDFGGVIEQLISIGGVTVSRSVQPAGWHWREHFQPLVAGEWCQAHHVGVTVQGRQAILFPDGTQIEYGPGDLYDVPPGHDGWTVGVEDCVMIEWSGMRRWVGGATPHRVLASLLFTDIVDSTGIAARMGDAQWHDLLSCTSTRPNMRSSGSAVARSPLQATACSPRSMLPLLPFTAASRSARLPRARVCVCASVLTSARSS